MKAWEKYYYEVADREECKSEKRKKILDYILDNIQEGDKLLEIGCGTAIITKYLPENVTYIGLDVSDYALKMAKKRRNVKLINASADKIPFTNEVFDFVLAIFSLEHLNRPKESLLEMIRVLKRGSYLIICAPNLEMPLAFPSALRHTDKIFRLKFHFLRFYDYLLRLFGQYNFRIIKENYLQKTGQYEIADDDLVYLVSSFEVVHFLQKNGFKKIFVNTFRINTKNTKNTIKKWITYLPGMQYYGVELFIIAEKI